MHRLLILLSAGLLVFGMSGAATGAALNWEGTWSFDQGDFGKGSVYGGGVATVNGSSGGVPAHLSTLRLAGSRGQVGGTFTSYVTDPDTAGNGVAAIIWNGIRGGTGTFGPISGGAASTDVLTKNKLPTAGYVKLCLLSTVCTQYLQIPFTQPTTVNGVPGTGLRGVGVGGMQTIGGYGGIRMSLINNPWTVKTATLTDQITTTGGSRIFVDKVFKGWAHAPASTTTSSAQPGGVVQLVAPTLILTNLPLGSADKLATGGIFVIRFIPEPGLLLLLGSGVAGLALLGRRQMRR